MDKTSPFPVFDTLTLEQRGAVAVMTLNRPSRLNAIDIGMRFDLPRAVEAVRVNSEVRALVVTGAGRAFCAGGDMQAIGASALDAESGRKRISEHSTWLDMLVHFDRPVIAAVNGLAFGAGFSLALMADFVVAAEEARFCAAFQRVGLTPDGGMHWLLVRAVGLRKAKDILMTTREIDITEARQLGLVNFVYPREQVLQKAIDLATGFAAASPTALAMSKEMLDTAWSSDLRTIVRMEAAALGVNVSAPYHREAVGRFLRKEPGMFPPKDWVGSTRPKD